MSRSAHRIRARYGWTALVLLGTVGPACRTGGPAQGPSAPRPDFIRSYVGQAGILPGRGDQKKWSVDRKNVGRAEGACDVAVEVRDAGFEKGVVQLRMATLGPARVEGRKNGCPKIPPEIVVRVAGFGPEEPAEAVTSAVRRVFLTPEALLAVHGIKFERPPAASQPLVADRSPVAKQAEMRLARDVTRWPRKILWVEPSFTDPRHKIHHEGILELAFVVGSDGRVHEPQIVTPLDEAHARLVTKTFPLWRFEPAQRGEEPVGARLPDQTILRIYRK